MSISKGNEFLKAGHYEKAIEEYQKIDKNSSLRKLAEINIRLALLRKTEAEKTVTGHDHTNNKSKTTDTVLTDNHSTVKSSEKTAQVGNEPLVSVIMPVYNVAPYLDASIMSVLNQTYKNIELIIVNDASSDNSLNIINMYKQKDHRIRVRNFDFNTLGGAGIPSNVGIDSAKGKYIAFADSDDILDEFGIEKMVESAEKEQVDVVIADFALFNDETRIIVDAYDKDRLVDIPVGESFKPKDHPSILDMSAVPWRKLYKREFLNKKLIRYPEGDYFYEDNPLHWFVLAEAKSVLILDYVVAFHRMEREGQTMGSDNYKMSALIYHMNSVRNKLISDKSVPASVWEQYALKCASYDWIFGREKNERIKNLLKKRNAKLLADIINNETIFSQLTDKTKSHIKKKRKEYEQARSKTDLSIIVPIYNCEDLLENTLQQLASIKGIKYDVFLMDDGSEDNSKILCESFTEKHDNFFYFYQKNKGAGVARNSVIPLANGTYTFFLDSDDSLDTKALVESLKYAESGHHDLLMMKYKLSFYDRKTSREMFDSDKKIWDQLLKSSSHKERQVLASGMINYPWNRLIKTDLLHDHSIFFGKTVVHNDIPYHWHSIIASENIGIFDKAVCDHRKFDTRQQITNIEDDRRMMVFEAYRYTQHVLRKYDRFEAIFPTWKKFISHILVWAKGRIPDYLTLDYENRRIIVEKELERLDYELSHHKQYVHPKPQIGYYRIIGNVIPGLHADSQGLINLKHIVEKESSPDDFEKNFVLNRIYDESVRQDLINYLELKQQKYVEIKFDLNEYIKCGYDLASLPSSYYWFEKKWTWHDLVQNAAVRNFKNMYLMNNNGARNFAILHGKEKYEWTMPWDGNCFLSDESFRQLDKAFNESKDTKYIVTPMERSVSNDDIAHDAVISNAVEEPQISFRWDAKELLNPERVYGIQSKVELFKRLGFKGPWDKIVNLYPWRELEYQISPEAGDFESVSGVFRLASGNAQAAVDGRTRSHTRSQGVSNFIDLVESDYVAQHYHKVDIKSELATLLSARASIEALGQSYKDIFVSKNGDINALNSKERLNTITYGFCKGLIAQEDLDKIDIEKLRFKYGVDLQNPNVFMGTLNNHFSLLLVQLMKGNFLESVSAKLDLVMLLYYHQDNLDLTANAYFGSVYKSIVVLFDKVFGYNVEKDLQLAKSRR